MEAATRRLKDACAAAAARVERASLALEVANAGLAKARGLYLAAVAEEGKPTIERMLKDPSAYLTNEEKAFCTNNNVILAIKSLRNRIPGFGLKEAKDVVDAFRYRTY